MPERLATSFADPSAPYRLPYTIEPQRYELRLAPDMEDSTFTGEVSITAVLHGATESIVMHAAELTITSATVIDSPRDVRRVAVASTDEDRERLTLSVGNRIDPGRIVVEISFAGVLNDQLRGFYRSQFTDPTGASRTLATTQFEATDARRAFPCFDEPDRKAVFSITLDVPSGTQAFSNGPVVEQVPLGDGITRVRFADTMKMSTYLVAFAVGPLVASAPRDVDGTPVRVVHVPGKEGLTTYALDVAEHALRFFSEWFGIAYPADKLDLLAIPDFATGAMENLGCVTFRESILLVDENRAARVELERIADVVAHEIAHMWFGDLVTMRWWNGVWLNEAFATYMQLLCIDAWRPQWRRWASFGVEREMAMTIDALHSTRPIEYPVGSPEEAEGMFDVLTYQKGAGVLRMLERYLGTERFRDGIRLYLGAHRYSTTETSDLWDALEEASGEPVRDMMDGWIFQGGFPLVTVEVPPTDNHEPSLRLSQEHFVLAPSASADAGEPSWRVPVLARSADGVETRLLLDGDPATIADDGATRGTVVNAGGWGFYRVHYPADQLAALLARLGALDALERFNLVGDTWAAVLAGRSPLSDFLTVAEVLGTAADPDAWAQVVSAVGLLDRAMQDSARPALGGYTVALMRPVLERVGWEPRAEEDERTATLRAQLLGTLGAVGADPEVRNECARRFAASESGEHPLDPDTASAILDVVATGGGPAEFDAFVERYRHAATPQEELRFLYALAAFRSDELAGRAFDMACSEIRSQDAPFLVRRMLANRETGPSTWLRLRATWDEVVHRFPDNNLSRMLDTVRFLCRDNDVANDVTEFLGAHPIPIGQRSVEQALELLRVNVDFARRLEDGAAAALAAGSTRVTKVIAGGRS